jgi:hypothetical protein
MGQGRIGAQRMTTFEKWLDINALVLHESADKMKEYLAMNNQEAIVIQGWAIVKQIESFWQFVERKRKSESTQVKGTDNKA